MTSEKRVLLSIIIPCFNDLAYVFQAVDSCLVQEAIGVDFEIVIVDDGSTDGTLEELRRKYDEIEGVLVLGLRHGGVSKARNIGVQVSSGDYVMFLDADDRLGRRFVQSVAMRLRIGRHGEDLVVLSPYVYFASEQGDASKEMSWFVAPRLKSEMPPFNRFCILTGNCFPISSCALPRRLFDEVGGFDVGLTHHEDWDLWIRVFSRHLVVSYTDDTYDASTYIRMRAGAMSNKAEMARSRAAVINRHVESGWERALRFKAGWYTIRILRWFLIFNQLLFARKWQNLTFNQRH
jgi:glycosyltransferase involved in cell wall biosynthesis